MPSYLKKIIIVSLPIVVLVFVLVGRSATETTRIESGSFKVIKLAHDKNTTNIVLVHGVGNHCIGYGGAFRLLVIESHAGRRRYS